MGNKKMSKRKAFYILLAILVSAAIWFYVDEFGNNGSARLVEQKVTDIPIEYISEDTLTDRGLMLLKDGTKETIDLVCKGSRRTVTRLDRSKIRVTVNLSNVTGPGMQSIGYQITYTDRNKFNDKTVDIT